MVLNQTVSLEVIENAEYLCFTLALVFDLLLGPVKFELALHLLRNKEAARIDLFSEQVIFYVFHWLHFTN